MPDWLSKLLGRFDSLEAKLATGSTELQSKLTIADEKVKLLDKELADAKQSISTLETAATSHAEAITAKDAKITALEAELLTEKKNATEAIAGQSLPAEQLPAGSTDNSMNNTDQRIKSIREKIKSSQDPKEKYNLAQEIKALIAKSKN